MVPINTIPFFIALFVTGIPLAVGPATVLLIEFSGDQHGGYEGLVMLGAILTMGVIASAYAAVVSIIGFALLRMLKKTLPRARYFIRPWHRRSNRRNPGNPRHGRRLRPNLSRPSRRSHCAV